MDLRRYQTQRFAGFARWQHVGPALLMLAVSHEIVQEVVEFSLSVGALCQRYVPVMGSV